MKYIKIFIATLSLLSVTGCGTEDKDKKGRAALEEISTEYGCIGLTNNGKNLICGTSGGTIVSINPYTGEASEIYDVERPLRSLSYMGYDKYVFEKEHEHHDTGPLYKFDIHEKLKNTLSRFGSSYSRGGTVYDQNTKLLYSLGSGSLFIDDGTTKKTVYIGVGGRAMAQTDKYIYIAESWGSAIVQYNKNELLSMKESNSKNMPTKVYIDYKNYAYYNETYGIQGMTIFRGDIFIYYLEDGLIHKLDVNLLDYDDSVDVKMRT